MWDDNLWLVKWSWGDQYKVMLLRRRERDIEQDYFETNDDRMARARSMIGYNGGTIEITPVAWGMSHGSNEVNYDADMVLLDI